MLMLKISKQCRLSMGIKIIILFPRTPVEDAAYCYRCSVVCVSVCLLDITVSCAKTAEPIEMPFVLWARVGQKNNQILGRIPSRKGTVLGALPTMLSSKFFNHLFRHYFYRVMHTVRNENSSALYTGLNTHAQSCGNGVCTTCRMYVVITM